MKALILAAGRGNRINELSVEQNKCMIRMRGKLLIEYNLDCALSIKVNEIILVVGYRAEMIINYFGNSYKGTSIKYVIQQEQKGLVNAIESAQKALNGEDFFLMLGDEVLLNPQHQAMVESFFNDRSIFGICGVLSVTDRNQIKKTYTFLQGEDKVIYRLIEKPRNPLNDMQGTGHCVFKNSLLEYIKYTPIHHERNEKELPDLIQCAIDDGKIIKSFNICDKYTNINNFEDITIAEEFFGGKEFGCYTGA
ncbi:MAG: nucleotidyltransferase family protein [Oligoflexales bacterium]|nr:nucleotidyltransferase family protein [Oligoflexales bacterium]